MRSRRSDIRIARKSEPSGTVSERVSNRQLRDRSIIKKAVKPVKPVAKIKKSTRRINASEKLVHTVKRTRKPKKSRFPRHAEVVSSIPPENEPKEVHHENNEMPTSGLEQKRRRTDMAEYIKKRFLYDLEDETKRSKHRKHRVSRVAAINSPSPRRPRLQNKHNWRSDTPSGDRLLHLRSRRGRRVKPKHDYSPLPLEGESSPSNDSQQNALFGRVKRHRERRNRKQPTSQESEVNQRRSTWELPDLFNADENDQLDDFSQQDPVVHDDHKHRFPDTTDLPNYSDVLLDDIPNRTAIMGAFEEHDRRRRVLREQLRRSDQRRVRHRHLASPNAVQKGANVFHQRTLLSPGHSSDMDQSDIITFCADQSTEQFRRRQEFDECEDHAEDEYLQSSGSRAPSEEPNQTPHEELEEEELLAPELSILAGQTDHGAALSGSVSNCGGSRRKSPVRPMQVLRTKSHASTNVSSQPSVLVSSSEDSPFIFQPSVANAGGYNRQLTGGGDEYLFQSSGLEKASSEPPLGEAHFGLKAASVLRLPNSSSTGANAIAIRSIPEHTLQIPVSTECSNSPSLLPSILSQSGSRVASPVTPRAFTSASGTRPTATGPGKSLLSHSTSSASRRRPTILKRGAESAVFGAQRHQEVEDVSIHTPVSRTIGAFTPSHAIKTATTVQVVPTTTTGSTTPAKLLQLVTTPTSSPQLATNLTASDKLFGRRPSGSVLSTTSITLPNTGTTYVDVSEAQANSAHPVSAPYRYAVLRGSADGKRYLVLGNQGLFDRNNNITMDSVTVSSANDESGAENAEAIEALQSHANLNLETSGSDAKLNNSEDCSVEANDCIDSSHAPTLHTHLQPSFTFSTSIPAPSTHSVAAI